MKINKEREYKISKSLSYWLRHNPDDIGVTMSSNGWVDIRELLDKSEDKILFDYNELLQVVKNNKKQRFSLDRNMCMIRANQGHSKKLVDKIGLKLDNQVEVIPPRILYHGTKKDNLEILKKEGLKPMSRQHVHLSVDEETAETVAGRRKGKWVILGVMAKKMHDSGGKILVSENGIYLTDEVPPEFIIFK